MFRTANDALRWSFQMVTTDTTKLSSVNMMGAKRLASSVNDTVSGLTKMESVSQAVNIINDVRMLPNKAESACLMIEYGHDYFGKDVDYLSSLILCRNEWEDKRLDGVKMLVRNCFGHKTSTHDMREGLGCNYNRLSKYRNDIYVYLDKLSSQAYCNIGAVLKLKNIVRS